MSADPRAALNQLVSAFERHLEACSTRHGEDDPSVVAAYEDLADAFEVYDGALYDTFGEMTPLDIYIDEGEGERDDEVDDIDEVDVHDDEDGDAAQLYSGLDDDIDFDDDEDEDDDEDDEEDAESER